MPGSALRRWGRNQMGARTHAHTRVTLYVARAEKATDGGGSTRVRTHAGKAKPGETRGRAHPPQRSRAYVRTCARTCSVRPFFSARNARTDPKSAAKRTYVPVEMRTYVRNEHTYVRTPVCFFRTLRCTLADRLVLMAIASAYLHLPRASSVRTHVQDHHAQFVWL